MSSAIFAIGIFDWPRVHNSHSVVYELETPAVIIRSYRATLPDIGVALRARRFMHSSVEEPPGLFQNESPPPGFRLSRLLSLTRGTSGRALTLLLPMPAGSGVIKERHKSRLTYLFLSQEVARSVFSIARLASMSARFSPRLNISTMCVAIIWCLTEPALALALKILHGYIDRIINRLGCIHQIHA
jgi:hypothetical protein